jgi:type VI secretion system secreted protein VgrG
MNKIKLVSLATILVVTLSLVRVTTNVTASRLAASAPNLGDAAGFSVLGATEVTNSGATTANGAVGVSPGTAIDGGITATGGIHSNDPSAIAAKADALAAYGSLGSQGPGSTIGSDLSGQILVPGVYTVPGVSLLSGTLTLNGPGVYIFLTSGFQAGGLLTLTNGARACDVFWHDTSSVNITGSLKGTVIAQTSITFGTGASLDGRALALTGNVTLLANTFSGPSCPAAQIPSATNTTAPEATNTTAPEATNTTAPGATNTTAPGATNTTAPEATNTTAPGATNTIAPQAASTSTPQTASTTTPGINNTVVPGSTLIPGVSGPPSTGGAPIQDEAFPWSMVLIVGGFSLMAVFLSIQAYRRYHLMK